MVRNSSAEGIMTFQELLKKHLSPTDFQRMQDFMASMEPEQRAGLMQFIAQRETLAPAVGTEAPDFELPQIESTARVRTPPKSYGSIRSSR